MTRKTRNGMAQEQKELLSTKTKVRSVFLCLFLLVMFGVLSIPFPDINLLAIFPALLSWLGIVLGVSVVDIYRGGKP